MPRDADGRSAHAVPLAIALPDALAAAPDRVVLLVVRGLPEGARLSAGVASGDGSWLLSPADLPGLSLTPSRDRAADVSIELTAIGKFDGDFRGPFHEVVVGYNVALDASDNARTDYFALWGARLRTAC